MTVFSTPHHTIETEIDQIVQVHVVGSHYAIVESRVPLFSANLDFKGYHKLERQFSVFIDGEHLAGYAFSLDAAIIAAIATYHFTNSPTRYAKTEMQACCQLLQIPEHNDLADIKWEHVPEDLRIAKEDLNSGI